VGHDQDVREHDGSVEAEAPDWLQRHLGGKFRVVAEVQERSRPWRAPPGIRTGNGPPAASSRREEARRPRRPAPGRLPYPALRRRSRLLKRNLESESLLLLLDGLDSPPQGAPQPAHKPSSTDRVGMRGQAG
jgi:hypothetical protein